MTPRPSTMQERVQRERGKPKNMGASEKSQAFSYGGASSGTWNTASPTVVIDQRAWDDLKNRVKVLEKHQSLLLLSLIISALFTICLFLALVIAFG